VCADLQYKAVVTSFLQAGERILILRRSRKVGSYQGRWAGVSGYIEGNEEPLQRARTEIAEEVGLNSSQATLVRAGEVLRTYDEEADTVWIIHPFLFRVESEVVRLDWEHMEHQWIAADDLRSYETVPKLVEAFERVRWDLQTASVALSNIAGRVDEVANDRAHGASYLGRRSLEIVKEAVLASEAHSPQELFRDALAVGLKLRRAQPSMATIVNLTGKLLQLIHCEISQHESIGDFRQRVLSLAEEAVSAASAAAENASKNSLTVLPERPRVLTHSYSSSVRRVLELGRGAGRECFVYVTESGPGFEGRQFAKDLDALGLPVKLVADSDVISAVSNVDVVLMGADSVLADGSLVNKVGTNDIAAAAKSKGVPFYVVTETAKLSTSHFLGEPVRFSELFDLTLNQYVSGFITELGLMKPSGVEQRIREMLRELYT
jgi:ribose 1,5-bisphosphate isomerase